VSLTGPIVELIYEDWSGSTGSLTIHCKSGTTVVEAEAGANTLASAVSSLTDAVLVRVRIKWRKWTDGPIDYGTIGDIRRCGVFIISTNVEDEYALVEVPGLRDSALIMSGNGEGVLLDLTQVDVADFVAALIADGVSDPFGEALVALQTAYLQSRA
jgi:hypothetical protein